MSDLAQTRTDKGERGFALDIHLTFAAPLPREEALELLRVLSGLTAEPYARLETPGEVPSARLTGPMPEASTLQAALRGWLSGPVRVAEAGLRGYLRLADGYTEWMPWRKNVVLTRDRVEDAAWREGEKYIFE